VQPDSPDQPTVGATFRAAREALGISPIEAADLLNLTLRAIEALEKDDYESLPGRVYVSGYVRAYAKMLGLDAGDLISRYTALHEDSDDSPLSGDRAEPKSRHHVNKMPVSLTLKQWGYVAAGFIVLVLLISFFDDIPRPTHQPIENVRASIDAETTQRESTSSSSSLAGEDDDSKSALSSLVSADSGISEVEAPNGAAKKTPVATQVAEVSEAQSDAEVLVADEFEQPAPTNSMNAYVGEGLVETPSVSTPSVGDESESDIPETAAEAPEVPEVPEAAPAAKEAASETGSASFDALADEASVGNEYQVPYLGEDESGARKLSVVGDAQLRYEFSADCWIEIRSLDDELLYADLGRAGEVRQFVGEGPFKLKIGFAEGVRLFFDAQEIDLAPYTRNQMARLELDQ